MKKYLRKILLLFFCALPLTISAQSSQAAAANSTYGLHGMIIFGNQDGLYAVHLPMFHAPHDYQVVLRIHLADPVQDAELKQRLQQTPTLWTLEPEQFDLLRLTSKAVAPLLHFQARIFSGHFERDGILKYADTQIMVDETLVFRQLNPRFAASRKISYWQIGTGIQRFLLKQIDARPDFDHLLRIQVKPHSATTSLQLKRSGTQNTQKPERQALEKELQATCGTGAKIVSEIYFDHADLE